MCSNFLKIMFRRSSLRDAWELILLSFEAWIPRVPPGGDMQKDSAKKSGADYQGRPPLGWPFPHMPLKDYSEVFPRNVPKEELWAKLRTAPKSPEAVGLRLWAPQPPHSFRCTRPNRKTGERRYFDKDCKTGAEQLERHDWLFYYTGTS